MLFKKKIKDILFMINNINLNIFIKIVKEEININLQIFYLRKNYSFRKVPTEKISFNFSYNQHSTFEDLMDHIIPLSHTKICPCFIFYYNNKKKKLILITKLQLLTNI